MSELHQQPDPAAQAERNRRAARRTALLFGAIAVAVYVGFLLLGVMGQ